MELPPELTLTECVIRVEHLNIADEYQRTVTQSMVKRISKSYNVVLFGRLLVGHRKDDTCWIVDGQTRYQGARLAGIEEVPCMVFESYGQEHEAKIFRQVNTERTNVHPLAMYKALLTEKDPITLRIDSCVNECGFKVPYKGNKAVSGIQLRAVTTLYQIYKRGGDKLLLKVLNTISLIWPDNKDASDNNLLGGVALFIHKYEGEYNQSELVKKLKKIDPKQLLILAATMSKGLSMGESGRKNAIMYFIVTKYNQGRTVSRLKLDNESTSEEET